MKKKMNVRGMQLFYLERFNTQKNQNNKNAAVYISLYAAILRCR